MCAHKETCSIAFSLLQLMLLLVETFCNSIYALATFLDTFSAFQAHALSLLMSYKFEYNVDINRICIRPHKNNGRRQHLCQYQKEVMAFKETICFGQKIQFVATVFTMTQKIRKTTYCILNVFYVACSRP